MSEVLLTKTHPGETALTSKATDVELVQPVVEFVAAINRGDLDAAVALLTPDHLHHGRVSNYRPEGVKVLFTLLRSVLPDLRLDIREMKVEGNQVISRIVGTGVHTGSYLGKKPTGRPVAWQSVDIAEITSTGISEIASTGVRENDWRISKRFWDVFNDPSLWKEIGFIPAIMC
jgi:predicted ester cyclase